MAGIFGKRERYSANTRAVCHLATTIYRNLHDLSLRSAENSSDHVLEQNDRRCVACWALFPERMTSRALNFSLSFPIYGVYYFEAEAIQTEVLADRWCAIGVAGTTWDVMSCGWWSENKGVGWYSASEDAFDEQSGTQSTISSGDVIGCVCDRDKGRVLVQERRA